MPPKNKGKTKEAKGDKGKGKDAKGKGKDKGKGKGKGKKEEEEPLVEKVEEVKPPKPPPVPLTEQNKPYLEERAKSVTVKLLMKQTPLLYYKNIKPHLGTPIHRILQEIEHPHLIQYMKDIGMRDVPSPVLNLKKIDNRTPILGPTGIEELYIDRMVVPSMAGVAPHIINKHAFVMYVEPHSPAHYAGLRFGDEILDVNDAFVHKWKIEELVDFIIDQPSKRYEVVIRRRPFTRQFTLKSGKCEDIGYQIHDGRIINVYNDTEAHRKGLLVNYQIIEINNKNVIGMDDKQMRFAFQRDKQFTITIMPGLIYEHLMDKMDKETVFSYYDKFYKTI